MNRPYIPSQLETESLFQVRFLLGDTDFNNYLLQDTEILFSLVQTNNHVKKAALICLKTLIYKFSNEAITFKLGPYSEDPSIRLESLKQLEKELTQELIGINTPFMKEPTTNIVFSYDLMANKGG